MVNDKEYIHAKHPKFIKQRHRDLDESVVKEYTQIYINYKPYVYLEYTYSLNGNRLTNI